MNDMPESICDWCDETDPQRSARCPVKGCGRAPLTPAEAMARCPQVAEMASAVDDYMRNRGASEHARRLAAALAPFTKGSDG